MPAWAQESEAGSDPGWASNWPVSLGKLLTSPGLSPQIHSRGSNASWDCCEDSVQSCLPRAGTAAGSQEGSSNIRGFGRMMEGAPGGREDSLWGAVERKGAGGRRGTGAGGGRSLSREGRSVTQS